MTILENISLQPFNTFGVDVNAKYFTEAKDITDWQALQQAGWLNKQHLILGGGSNILFLKDFPGLVIRQLCSGVSITGENDEHVWVKAMAGEPWHSLVMYTVENGWGGIENLSLIPGLAGAAPMQNIGAYGVELQDVFVSLEAMELTTGRIMHFDKEDCRFGYRQSIFKTELKGQYVILSITLRLSKKPTFNISYGAIRETLEKSGVEPLSVKAVSDAVIAIRRSKLPDPLVLGNAGSFFKNPAVPEIAVHALLENHPAMPHYAADNGLIKVPAGWLIEQCGWKGKRVGHTGCHAEQALVIVNYGHATGEEIWAHARQVQTSVLDKFGILLEPEVNLIS